MEVLDLPQAPGDQRLGVVRGAGERLVGRGRFVSLAPEHDSSPSRLGMISFSGGYPTRVTPEG